MPSTFDTYCAVSEDLDGARTQVEETLAIELALHDSHFWGGDYYLARSQEWGKIAVRRNLNRFTGELTEAEFPDCTILVSVSDAPDPDRMKERLVEGGLRFLKRVVV